MSPGQRRESAPLFGEPTQRTPVHYDPATGALRIGEHERRVDASEPSAVYGAYLCLLYAVRGAKPGQQLPLRSADLEALLLIVGDDAETIEQRLVGLMGCSADEAKALSKILLRHRKLTATLGIAAALSLGATGVVGASSADAPVLAQLVQSAVPDDARTPLGVQTVDPAAADVASAPSAPTTTSAVLVGPFVPPAAKSTATRDDSPAASADSAPAVAAPAAAAPAPPKAVVAPAIASPEAPPADAPSVKAPEVADAWPKAPVDAAAPPLPAEDAPASDIGEAVFQEAEPQEELPAVSAPEDIAGVTDPSVGHEQPLPVEVPPLELAPRPLDGPLGLEKVTEALATPRNNRGEKKVDDSGETVDDTGGEGVENSPNG